ncbi:MAG TPA: exodeoxyribonuclease VII large subunit, partial [Rubrivivax sp.]|nr:exodeoxyribonuclease VII large subunit [Rubrivivax sp.]
CDLAADLRAPTPTAAAELVAPARLEALSGLAARSEVLQRVLRRGLQTHAQRLDTVALRLGQPAQTLRLQVQRLNDLARRLGLAVRHGTGGQAQQLQRVAQRLHGTVTMRVQQHRLTLDAAHERLRAHDPHRVLQRGYAWVESADGRPVISALALRPGQAVRAVWADGRARAEVLDVEPLPPSP